jgi:hypothetical protein
MCASPRGRAFASDGPVLVIEHHERRPTSIIKLSCAAARSCRPGLPAPRPFPSTSAGAGASLSRLAASAPAGRAGLAGVSSSPAGPSFVGARPIDSEHFEVNCQPKLLRIVLWN